MSAFYTPQELLENRVNVLLLGVGGTGGDVLDALVRLHYGILATGGTQGLHVTIMDGDTVSPSNIGRQRFGRFDLGRNKALLLTHRLALLHDLDWHAVPRYCELDEHGRAVLNFHQYDLLISCVDRADIRVGIAKGAAAARARGLWADFGNAARTGQFVLGHLCERPSGIERLPHVVDLYPELSQVNDTEEPSCSFDEAITRQDLFINPVLAYTGISMLWNLFRHGSLQRHAAFVDVERTSVQPLSIDTKAWEFFGYDAAARKMEISEVAQDGE